MGFAFRLLLGSLLLITNLLAAEPPKSAGRGPYAVDDEAAAFQKKQLQEAERLKEANPKQIRLFHEVLDELLNEMAYDVKSGQISGLKNLSIRKVSVSESLPRTYEDYVELLVAERIRENAKIRMISCLPCKTKNTRIVDDKLLISSPTTNTDDLNRAANQLGIENFMDVVLVYHTTHMVLAVQIFETSNKEMVWTRTYNSETLKTRFQKLAIDYSQIEKARTSDEYKPDFRYLVGFGGGSIPNVETSAREKSVLTLHVRGTEKFDNRRNEFGLLLTLNMAASALLSDYPSEGPTTATETTTQSTELKATPFTNSLGLFALYAHNFLGTLESYNDVRYGLNAGLGLHLASGYMAPTLRAGVDTYLGRRFSVNASVIVVGQANILLDGKFVKVPGGVGADVAVCYNM
ncbi:MAG TPA: hypothetical protein VE954_25860 [Oligoflexus sp.]|uniref:hypothetical protein n=1 Tax=Oligoflexus sp. TaxID=1971216 RepID=UPI002D56BD8E|nr:hypothetical protein [Oligoflexus sp.]HYX36549.1 hypothetical protein [Oligoflexus sp.]